MPTEAVVPQATTLPGPPDSPDVTVGPGTLDVSWTMSSTDGGNPLTEFTATAEPGGETCTTPDLDTGTFSCTIDGVTNPDAYTVSVTATTIAGTGPSSAGTSGVVPAVDVCGSVVGPEPTSATVVDPYAHLGGADLAGCNLSGLDLAGAVLGGSNLDGADLDGADLAGADLFESTFTDASFVGADLSGVGLDGIDLDGADLASADLSSVSSRGPDRLSPPRGRRRRTERPACPLDPRPRCPRSDRAPT